MVYDVIIIGGGPAGLSAGLLLGRCCRDVLILDANEPRNQASQALHGFLTQDGVTPWALRQHGRADLAHYPSVRWRQTRVNEVRREEVGFEVVTEEGIIERSRLLLLATGRIDRLPDISGLQGFYGRGVYHCPYCDGWEHHGKKLGVLGTGQAAFDLAEELLTWSDQVTIYLDGEPEGSEATDFHVEVVTDPILELRGNETDLETIHLASGVSKPCDALFFCTECEQRSTLPKELGCLFDHDGAVVCEEHAAKNVSGLYIAGNVRGGVHLAITAAAEGAETAIAMNEALLKLRGRTAGATSL